MTLSTMSVVMLKCPFTLSVAIKTFMLSVVVYIVLPLIKVPLGLTQLASYVSFFFSFCFILFSKIVLSLEGQI